MVQLGVILFKIYKHPLRCHHKKIIHNQMKILFPQLIEEAAHSLKQPLIQLLNLRDHLSNRR